MTIRINCIYIIYMNTIKMCISVRPFIRDLILKEAKRRQVNVSRCIEDRFEFFGAERQEESIKESQIRKATDACLSGIKGYKDLPKPTMLEALSWAWEDFQNGDFNDMESFKKAVDGYTRKG